MWYDTKRIRGGIKAKKKKGGGGGGGAVTRNLNPFNSSASLIVKKNVVKQTKCSVRKIQEYKRV